MEGWIVVLAVAIAFVVNKGCRSTDTAHHTITSQLSMQPFPASAESATVSEAEAEGSEPQAA